ncbi:hypothetical protein PV10_01240 [Exophiala mesophila]|uniref:Uncharacterized protein n=1 Tax=Exophiala mesophila TaxID=212818 RepID=A0A0D1X6P4_EXOME|nr:uncharacterized protein PV10_01240 [Exophiala mesophila]KIV97490.1 hypothetical protein PV10_01240 [Exophiala mesophila]
MQPCDIMDTDYLTSNSPTINGEYSHRGCVNSDGNVETTCSLKYLTSLCLEVLRARSAPMVELATDADESSRIRRLQFVSTEVRRLFQNPALFPSDAARVRFASIIALDANLQFVEAVQAHLIRAIQEELDSQNREYSRPHYVEGSKGWENFLCNMMPGVATSNRPSETTPKSSLQAIPSVGLRIVGDLSRQDDNIIVWDVLNPKPPEMPPAATTRLINIDNPADQTPNPDISLSQQSYNTFIQPNPYREDETLRLDIPIQGPEAVEDYTALIARLEADPPPAGLPVTNMTGLNIFPMVYLRSWRPPTRLADLKHRERPRPPVRR